MLAIYRQEIDIIDSKVIALLAKRNEISQKIGNYKQDNNLSIYQSERRETILQNRKKQAEKFGLSGGFIQDIRNRIHQESLSIQQKNG